MQRLTQSNEIREVLRSRHCNLSTPVKMFFIPDDQNKGCVIVSKRVSKKAVERNRLKRQGREFLREKFQEHVYGRVVFQFVDKPEDNFSLARAWGKLHS